MTLSPYCQTLDAIETLLDNTVKDAPLDEFAADVLAVLGSYGMTHEFCEAFLVYLSDQCDLCDGTGEEWRRTLAKANDRFLGPCHNCGGTGSPSLRPEVLA